MTSLGNINSPSDSPTSKLRRSARIATLLKELSKEDLIRLSRPGIQSLTVNELHIITDQLERMHDPECSQEAAFTRSDVSTFFVNAISRFDFGVFPSETEIELLFALCGISDASLISSQHLVRMFELFKRLLLLRQGVHDFADAKQQSPHTAEKSSGSGGSRRDLERSSIVDSLHILLGHTERVPFVVLKELAGRYGLDVDDIIDDYRIERLLEAHEGQEKTKNDDHASFHTGDSSSVPEEATTITVDAFTAKDFIGLLQPVDHSLLKLFLQLGAKDRNDPNFDVDKVENLEVSYDQLELPVGALQDFLGLPKKKFTKLLALALPSFEAASAGEDLGAASGFFTLGRKSELQQSDRLMPTSITTGTEGYFTYQDFTLIAAVLERYGRPLVRRESTRVEKKVRSEDNIHIAENGEIIEDTPPSFSPRKSVSVKRPPSASKEKENERKASFFASQEQSSMRSPPSTALALFSPKKASIKPSSVAEVSERARTVTVISSPTDQSLALSVEGMSQDFLEPEAITLEKCCLQNKEKLASVEAPQLAPSSVLRRRKDDRLLAGTEKDKYTTFIKGFHHVSPRLYDGIMELRKSPQSEEYRHRFGGTSTEFTEGYYSWYAKLPSQAPTIAQPISPGSTERMPDVRLTGAGKKELLVYPESYSSVQASITPKSKGPSPTRPPTSGKPIASPPSQPRSEGGHFNRSSRATAVSRKLALEAPLTKKAAPRQASSAPPRRAAVESDRSTAQPFKCHPSLSWCEKHSIHRRTRLSASSLVAKQPKRDEERLVRASPIKYLRPDTASTQRNRQQTHGSEPSSPISPGASQMISSGLAPREVAKEALVLRYRTHFPDPPPLNRPCIEKAPPPDSQQPQLLASLVPVDPPSSDPPLSKPLEICPPASAGANSEVSADTGSSDVAKEAPSSYSRFLKLPTTAFHEKVLQWNRKVMYQQRNIID